MIISIIIGIIVIFLISLIFTYEINLDITPYQIVIWYTDQKGHRTFKILYKKGE